MKKLNFPPAHSPVSDQLVMQAIECPLKHRHNSSLVGYQKMVYNIGLCAGSIGQLGKNVIDSWPNHTFFRKFSETDVNDVNFLHTLILKKHCGTERYSYLEPNDIVQRGDLWIHTGEWELITRSKIYQPYNQVLSVRNQTITSNFIFCRKSIIGNMKFLKYE